MPWPLASSYSAMLQSPAVAFRDESLRRATIHRDQNNQPFGMSGPFAVVYQAQLPNGQRLALRAFTSDQGPDRGVCCRVISEYLRQHREVRCLIAFEYHDKGIRAADGKMYPLVTMEWVRGATLFDWVRTKCLDRAAPSLTRAAERWVDLIQELADAQIAHGNLQHANVMVTEQDEFKLVDYDCMCVPALVGRRNPEIGVEPYQHPERNADTLLSPQLDNFSAIVIYVALRALAAAPQLWDELVEKNRYDKLLFHRHDFLDPGRSHLYQQLVRSPDQVVAQLTKDLFELYRGPLARVPSLKQFLFSYDHVRSLLSQRAWDQAVELIERHGGSAGAPADLQPKIREAQDRVNCRKTVERMVQAGDEAGMKQYYNPRLLDDYPAAQPVAQIARSAGQVLQVLDQLQGAKQQHRWRDLVRIWDHQRQLLESRQGPLVQAFRAEVDSWRIRNQLCDQVLGLIRQPRCDFRELAPAWDRLCRLQGHPDIERHRIEVLEILRWPKAVHFHLALQDSKVAFRNPEWRELKIAAGAWHLPRPCSGECATIYQASRPNGTSLAIRVFNTAAADRQERYLKIAEYLQRRPLKCFVPFTYEDAGIRSLRDGRWYPVLIMDWISGVTLDDWVRKNCRKRNQKHLATAVKVWLQTIDKLTAARVAHGDLSHGNVMVNDKGELKLVDYDCVCVPSLEQRANPETGTPAYQHPARTQHTLLSPWLDNFSAIVILVALKALAADPQLWDRFVEGPRCESLLFRSQDLRDPDDSPLFRELKRSPDAEVRRLSQRLAELARGSLDEVPTLADLAQEGPSPASSRIPAPGPSTRAVVRDRRAPTTAASAPAPDPAPLHDAAARTSEAPRRSPPEPTPKSGGTFDVFISYRRRGGGAELARLIRSELQQRGRRVFLDVDDLRSGHFDETLLTHIERAPNFLLILTPDSLARCVDQDDWLRREIDQAIRKQRNIIPLMAPGFEMPKPADLPDDLRPLAMQHGLPYSHEYFDAVMNKIVENLRPQKE
jgi:serine/threonine protein kinase